MAQVSYSGYRRKNYDELAYDKLGPKVRRALQEAVIEFDADWCLRMVSKHGADWVVKRIREGDIDAASKSFKLKRGVTDWRMSSFKDPSCKVKILRANW